MTSLRKFLFFIALVPACTQVDKGRDSVSQNIPDIDKGKGAIYSGSEDEPLTSDEIPAPLSIDVYPLDLFISEGMTASFTAIGRYPYFSRDLTAHVQWVSAAPNVVSFEDPRNANVGTGKSVGATLITATFKEVVGELNVNVIEPEIKAIVIEAESDSIAIPPNLTGGFVPSEITLRAIGVFTNQQVTDLTAQVQWTSSDEEVALFNTNQKGTVSFKKTGTTQISAEWNGVKSEKKFSVTQADVVLKSIELSDSLIDLPLGLSRQLIVTGHFSNGESRNITEATKFESANTAVAVFSSTVIGQVVAAGVGKTELTVSSAGVSASLPFVTTASVLTKVEITPKDITQPLGVPVQYMATGIYSDGHTENLTSSVAWSSSDLNTGSFDVQQGAEGLLNTSQTGDVTVSATFRGLSAETTLTVTDAELTTITINPNTVTMAKGITTVLTATGTYTDGRIVDVTTIVKWISGSPSVAQVGDTVGSKGVLSGTGVGTSIIRASKDGILGQINVNITAAQVVSLDVQSNNPTVALGRTKQFRAIATYTDESVMDVTESASWTFDILSAGYSYAGYVSDESGSKGMATSIAEGKVKILASFEGKVDSLDFTVTEKEIVYILVSAPKTVAFVGENVQFTATALYTDTSTLNVTNINGHPDLSIDWTEVDNNLSYDIVSIDNGAVTPGLVSALYEGGTTITARLTSVKFGIFDATLGLSVETDCTFGTKFSYYCFKLSAQGQSCAAACSASGVSVHDATDFFTGSAGDDNNCGQVLTAFGFTGGIEASGSHPTMQGVGCGILNVFGDQVKARYSSPATVPGHFDADFQRICACAP